MNVPPQWTPAIEQAQPFTAPHPRRHAMHVLHRLDITTKHRLLIPIELAFHICRCAALCFTYKLINMGL